MFIIAALPEHSAAQLSFHRIRAKAASANRILFLILTARTVKGNERASAYARGLYRATVYRFGQSVGVGEGFRGRSVGHLSRQEFRFHFVEVCTPLAEDFPHFITQPASSLLLPLQLFPHESGQDPT